MLSRTVGTALALVALASSRARLLLLLTVEEYPGVAEGEEDSRLESVGVLSDCGGTCYGNRQGVVRMMVIWFWLYMVLRIEYMVEKDHGFAMNYSGFNHANPNHQSEK